MSEENEPQRGTRSCPRDSRPGLSECKAWVLFTVLRNGWEWTSFLHSFTWDLIITSPRSLCLNPALKMRYPFLSTCSLDPMPSLLLLFPSLSCSQVCVYSCCPESTLHRPLYFLLNFGKAKMFPGSCEFAPVGVVSGETGHAPFGENEDFTRVRFLRSHLGSPQQL